MEVNNNKDNNCVVLELDRQIKQGGNHMIVDVPEESVVDGPIEVAKTIINGVQAKKRSNDDHSYASKKNVAEGMMDIALLTANANQLRFLITYNTDSKTFHMSVGLIILSLVLQVCVGIALIFKRQMKNRGKKNQASRTNEFLVGGVFLVTVINVFVAAFTITNDPHLPTAGKS